MWIDYEFKYPILQHDFNPVVSTKTMDICILIMGSYGPPNPISYRILVFPSLCQTILKTVHSGHGENAYTHYTQFCLSSDTMKGTPIFCKKWVLSVNMAPESECKCPCFWSEQWDYMSQGLKTSPKTM